MQLYFLYSLYKILAFTALIFITNIITAFYKKYYLYSLLFLSLVISSVIYHSNNNVYTNAIDKVCIFAVVSYGAYTLYNKKSKERMWLLVLSVLSFFATLLLFFYGYTMKQYCYHPDTIVGNKYHGLLHIISSFGHHCIIFM
jgi:hypothetical protein